MSNLQKRIKLSIKIIQQVKKIVQDEHNEQIENALNSLNHYLQNNFSDFSEQEQQNLSILMLNDAISLSYDFLKMFQIKNVDDQYMTIDQVKEKLFEEYSQFSKIGSEQIACLNLTDWLNKNCIKIIQKSSSTC